MYIFNHENNQQDMVLVTAIILSGCLSPGCLCYGDRHRRPGVGLDAIVVTMREMRREMASARRETHEFLRSMRFELKEEVRQALRSVVSGQKWHDSARHDGSRHDGSRQDLLLIIIYLLLLSILFIIYLLLFILFIMASEAKRSE